MTTAKGLQKVGQLKVTCLRSGIQITSMLKSTLTPFLFFLEIISSVFCTCAFLLIGCDQWFWVSPLSKTTFFLSADQSHLPLSAGGNADQSNKMPLMWWLCVRTCQECFFKLPRYLGSKRESSRYHLPQSHRNVLIRNCVKDASLLRGGLMEVSWNMAELELKKG